MGSTSGVGVVGVAEGAVQGVRMQDAIAACADAWAALARGEAVNHVRQRPRWSGGRMHVLAAAWPARGVAGLKVYLSTRAAPGGAGFLFVLHDAVTGAARAVLEAEALGRLRTGAMTGVATDRLARPDVTTAGVVGAGRQAFRQLEAVCAVRPIVRARVFSPTPERREAFAREAAARLRIEVTPAETVDAAVDDAGVIVTITTATAPFLDARHLRPGVHVNAAGSNDAARAELTAAAVARADRVFVDALDVALAEAGDLLQARDAGRFDFGRALPLGPVVAGVTPGRTSPEEVTLFESQGLGLMDLAVAAMVAEAVKPRDQ